MLWELQIRIPSKGQIFSNGVNITSLFPEQRNLGYLPQDNMLFPHLNVKENIAYPLRIKNNNNNKIILEIAEKLYISNILNRNIQSLSGGEIQRVALARCLVAGNKTLLLDEPTSALHYSLRNEFCYFLREIQKQFALNIIMVTHDITSAFTIADNIIFLMDNKIHQVFNNASKIKFIPANSKIAAFMGINNIFKGILSSSNTIISPALNTTLFIKEQIQKLTSTTIQFGIKPEDVRIIIAERKNEYANAVNKIKAKVKKIYNTLYFYTIIAVPYETNQLIEIHYPLTKSAKIQLTEDADIEIILKPECIFILDE